MKKPDYLILVFIAGISLILSLACSGSASLVEDGIGGTGQLCMKSNLPYFNDSVLAGYQDSEALRADLKEAGRLATLAYAEQSVKWRKNLMVYQDVSEGVSFPSRSENNSGDGAVISDDYTASPPTSSDSSTDSEEAAGEAGYETNNQVASVDEGDLIKSGGAFIYAGYGAEVVMLSTNGGEIARINLQPTGYQSYTISKLLLDSGRLAVISNAYSSSDKNHSNYTLLHLLDTSDSGMIQVSSSVYPGSINMARETGGNLVMAIHDYAGSGIIYSSLSSYMHLPDAEFLAKADEVSDEIGKAYADDILRRYFTDISRPFSEEDYPRVVRINRLRDGSESIADSYLFCGFGEGVTSRLTRVVHIDLSEGLESETNAAFFGRSYPGSAYMNDSLLVLSAFGVKKEDKAWQDATLMTGFTLNGNTVVPSAVGSVPGWLLNQFSMDFHDGHFRVATHLGAKWEQSGEQNWVQVSQSQSMVSVFEIANGTFNLTGQVKGLGNGERLYSCRFMDERAFVVTFKQVDPLYSIDLSDPTLPVARGELKVTGFSTYLHPMDDNTLIGVGYDVNPNTNRLGEMMISLFDVTDMDNPTLLNRTTVSGYSGSESLYDHHAFRYVKDKAKLIIPISVYSPFVSKRFDGFHVYDVSTDSGFVKAGEIVHAQAGDTLLYSYPNAYLPSRSLLFGDKLVTIKGHDALANDLDSLSSLWKFDFSLNSNQQKNYQWFYPVMEL